MPKQITVSKAHAIFAVVVTIAMLGASFGIAQQQIWTMRGELDAMKTTQALDHDSLTEIKVDVKWMRRRMEQEHDG